MYAKDIVTIDKFVAEVIKEVRAGINNFNKLGYQEKAHMPEYIDFEVCVDDNGDVGGDNKLNLRIYVATYRH